MNRAYEVGAIQALQDAGLVKEADAATLVGSALAGKLIGGGLGAAYPQYLGLNKDNRMLGGALGALLGGGLGVGAHEAVRYFRDLAAVGRPIVAKSRETVLKEMASIKEEANRMRAELLRKAGKKTNPI